MSKANNILLSRTASAVQKARRWAPEICNLVGQYLGTDIRFFQKGDIYVEMTGIHNEATGRRDYHWAPCSSTYVQVTDPGIGRGWIRNLCGRSYWEYEVIRRTPCRLRVKLVRRYDVYCPWTEGVRRVTIDEYDTYVQEQTLLGVFSRELSCEPRSMKVYYDDRDAAELERVKGGHTVTRLERGKTAKYDVENKELVVADL
jgi:hypothetical protein